MSDTHHGSGTEAWDVRCPECHYGRLGVSDVTHADCDNCDAMFERDEVGI